MSRDCGLPWTITATIAPSKDHIAAQYSVMARHKPELAYRGNHRPARSTRAAREAVA